jgi:hypothetical protein
LLQKLNVPANELCNESVAKTDLVFRVVCGTWHLICYHARVDHSFPVWQSILEEFDGAAKAWETTRLQYDSMALVDTTATLATTTTTTTRSNRKRRLVQADDDLTASATAPASASSELALRTASVRLYRLTWLIAYLSNYRNGDRVLDAVLPSLLSKLALITSVQVLCHPLQHPGLTALALDWLAGLAIIVSDSHRHEQARKMPIELLHTGNTSVLGSVTKLCDHGTVQIDRAQLITGSLMPLLQVAFDLPSTSSVIHLVRRCLSAFASPNHFPVLLLAHFLDYCCNHINADTVGLLVALHHVIDDDNWSRTALARIVSTEHQNRIMLSEAQQHKLV